MNLLPPIDVVYTWVNGSDPRLQQSLAAFKEQACREAAAENDELDADGCRADMASASRYVDNEELRFSLRSIVKFAPWIRRIYLVTNGQVPHWLRVDHPRLSVVSHAQIFRNLSHLPTFSSPAIEVHLHRIPGLADHFVYLNDDVMFGAPVFPDDFFTHSGGQNVFLSWAVPNCNDGCPANWIGDGYCDVACNVSACDWDNGDCRNATSRFGSSYGQGFQNTYSEQRWWNLPGGAASGGSWSDRMSKYCSPGCPDSWIGDKYCDRACESQACGYDGGDCGMEVISENMQGLALQPAHNRTHTALPDQTQAYYFNLTHACGSEATILDGSHDNSDLVRTATISQKNKVMILTFHREIALQNVSVSITFNPQEGATESQDFSFSFSLSTVSPPVENNNTLDDVNGTEIQTGSSSENLKTIDPTNLSTIDTNHSLSNVDLNLNSSSSDNDSSSNIGRKILSMDPFLTNIVNSPIRLPFSFVPLDDDAQNEPFSIKDHLQRLQAERDQFQRWILSKKHQDLAIAEEQRISNEFLSIVPPRSRFERLVEPHFDEISPFSASRKLLDIFGDSLKYVDRLYNRAYGMTARKVPAHMPHFINKNIMTELQSLWPEEYEITSSHRVRSANDMQMAFAYYYHLVHFPREFNIDHIFQFILDSDGDGKLNGNEFRTLCVYLYGSPLDEAKSESLYALLTSSSSSSEIHHLPVDSSSSSSTSSSSSSSSSLDITLESLKQQSEVLEIFSKEWKKQPKYRTTTQDTSNVAFLMVSTNNTNTQKSLDGIRSKRQRFICLNDNMNHSDPHSTLVVQTLREFYLSLVPIPSEFELTPDQFHPEGLYIDELVDLYYYRALERNCFVFVMLVITIIIICIIAKRKSKSRHLRPYSRDSKSVMQIL